MMPWSPLSRSPRTWCWTSSTGLPTGPRSRCAPPRSEERRVGERRVATRWPRDWNSDVCSSDLTVDGSARLGGRELIGRSTKQILDAGIGFVPEDRTHDALVPTFSVAENLVLDQFDRPPYGSAIAMRPAEIGRASCRGAQSRYEMAT